MDEVEVHGLRIAFERHGSGPPLVLLHGAVSDSRDWRRQFDALGADFTVVAWDGPGCGRSSDPPEGFQMAEYGACLAGFIAALGLERPHVLGFSWGSTVALELYRSHPKVPRSLVLVSAYAGWAGSLSASVIAERLTRARQESRLSPHEFARRWIPTLFTDRAPPEMVEEAVAIISEHHPAGVLTILESMAEADLRDVLPRIEIPTLLLYGAEDVRSPPHVAEALGRQISGSRLVYIAGVGHQCNVEAADRFNSEVSSFLTGL
jgi:pimeloyl-ACP methyl ester carboxylesterase